MKNLEEKRGKPARIVLGDPLPDEVEILPSPERLEERCTVAGESGGVARRVRAENRRRALRRLRRGVSRKRRAPGAPPMPGVCGGCMIEQHYRTAEVAARLSVHEETVLRRAAGASCGQSGWAPSTGPPNLGSAITSSGTPSALTS